MKVVWEVEIEQRFKRVGAKVITERHVEGEDLLWTLEKLRDRWLKEVWKHGDEKEFLCTGVKVLSARKICELT